MTTSDRPRIGTKKRVIYKISDSRQHLVGPSWLSPSATIYHTHPHSTFDHQPIHTHIPELAHEDTRNEVTSQAGEQSDPQCVGFIAAGSWGTASPECQELENNINHPNHPILDAIIEESHQSTTSSDFHCYSSSPSVLDLIPELQKPQSFYHINSSGSSTSIGSSGWTDGLDWGFNIPSVGISQQWSGHLKSVLLDVFNPTSVSNMPTIMQPRYKKSPGTSAALFVPSVMASIWRQYSDEAGPERSTSSPKPPIVTVNEDLVAPVSSSKTKDYKPLNKGKNAKTAGRSGSVERRRKKCIDVNHGIHGQHVMAGSRLSRHPLIKHLLASFKKEPADVELQDMSSYLPSDFSQCDPFLKETESTEDNPPPAFNHRERTTDDQHGEVTFFHYNSDGTDYTCTSVPITSPKPSRSLHRGTSGDMRGQCAITTSSESLVIIECVDSEDEDEVEEDEEKVIETVLIQDFEHNNCACTRFSNNIAEDGCSVDAESSSFITSPLSTEFMEARLPNGNINGNCRQKEDVPSRLNRRSRTGTLRMPKILKNKKVHFTLTPNQKYRPRILGSENCDDTPSKTTKQTLKQTLKRTGKHVRGKHKENIKMKADTLRHSESYESFEWPDNYIAVKPPLRWIPPGIESDIETYLTVASRNVPTVYVKIYIQVPPNTHLCELKTHLLICIFRSFFTTTEGLHITWVMSLQSHVYNLLYMNVARLRFRRDSNGRPCRACLLLSKDATTLVRHKRSGLLSTITDILQIDPEELLVLEKERIIRSWSAQEKIANGRKTLNHQVR